MDTEISGEEEMLERQPSDAIKAKTALPCDDLDTEEPVLNGDSNGLHSPTSSESNHSQPQSDNQGGDGKSDEGTSDMNHENDTNNEKEQNSLNNHSECSSDAPECDGKKSDGESVKDDNGSEASKDSNVEGELCESSKAGDIRAGEEPSLTSDKDSQESKSEAERDEHEQMDVDESDNGKSETPLEGSDKLDQAEKPDQAEKEPALNVNGLDGDGHTEEKQEKDDKKDDTADVSDVTVMDTRGCDSPTELMDVSEKADSTDTGEDNDVIMVNESPVKGQQGKPDAVKGSSAENDGKSGAIVILDDGKNKISAKVGDLEAVTSETVTGQAAKGPSIKFTTTNKVVTSAAGSASGAFTKDGTPLSQATSILKIKNSPKIEGLRESLLKQTSTSRSVSAPAVPDFAKEMRPVAAILSQIGMNLVREHVYSDLIKVQSRKLGQNKLNAMAVKQLGMLKTAAQKLSDENKKYKLKMHLCGYCGYKCDGENVMALHLEFPHIDGNDLKCAKCDFVTRAKQQFTFHMDVEHFSQAKYVSPFHLWQCKFCKFEADQVKTFNRHIIKCAKAFNLKRNLEPSATDCDIPLKKSKAMMRQAVKSQASSAATVRSVLNNSPATKPATSSSIVLAIPTSSSATRVNTAAVTKTKVATSYAVPQPVAVQKPTVGRVPTKFTTVRQALAGAQGTASTSVRMPVQVQGQRQPVVINYPIQPQVSGALPGNAMFTVVNQAGQLYLQPTQIATMAGIQISPPNAVVQTVAQPVVQKSASVVQTVRPASVAVTQSSKSKGKAAAVASAAAPHFEVCEICGGFVKDIPSLRIHFYWKHGIDIPQGADTPAFTCFLCYNPKAFWTARGLQQHREKEHGVSSHGTIQQTSAKQTAPKPQVNIVKQQPPQPVKKLEPGGKVHSCYLCGVSSEKILDHLYFAHRVSLSTMTKMRKCLICGLELATDEAFSFHLNSYHKLATQIASQKYATSPAVRPIIPAVSVKEPQGQHKCYRCNKAWQTREDLQLHFAQVHRCEKEECLICHDNINIGRPFIRHVTREHLKELKVNIKRMSKEQLEKYSVNLNDSVSDKKPVEKKPVEKPAEKASVKDATPAAIQDQDKGTKFKEILQVDGEEIILEVAESDDEK